MTGVFFLLRSKVSDSMLFYIDGIYAEYIFIIIFGFNMKLIDFLHCFILEYRSLASRVVFRYFGKIF